MSEAWERDRLLQELESYKKYNASLIDKVRELDMAEVARRNPPPPKDNHALKWKQDWVAKELANPKAVEDYRAMAQQDYSLSPEKWNGNEQAFYQRMPRSDGSWPPGYDRETFIRQQNGLSADGKSLIDQAPEPEPEKAPEPLSDWLQGLINKAGKT
jgi:hypothetical protein